MSVIFYHNDEQQKLALETKEQKQVEWGREIYTEIVPASGFYLAEAYHQKYQLQRIHDLARELHSIYPNTEDFVNSTAVTRINGYVSGYGRMADLEKELGELGLSPNGNEKLLEIMRRYEPEKPSDTCPTFYD
jgi:peptide-methionine (S)-S-oxide reductase